MWPIRSDEFGLNTITCAQLQLYSLFNSAVKHDRDIHMIVTFAILKEVQKKFMLQSILNWSMLHNSLPHLDSKSFSLSSYIFSHIVAVLPRRTDFTLKMLCMHHIIPSRYVHPSGDFYSWSFAPDRRGNPTTKLCLGTYLTPLVMTVCKTLQSYTLGVA